MTSHRQEKHGKQRIRELTIDCLWRQDRRKKDLYIIVESVGKVRQNLKLDFNIYKPWMYIFGAYGRAKYVLSLTRKFTQISSIYKYQLTVWPFIWMLSETVVVRGAWFSSEQNMKKHSLHFFFTPSSIRGG